MMHQAIDHGGRGGGILVEDLSPLPEETIRAQHDRSGFVTGRHDLKQEIRAGFVDGQIGPSSSRRSRDGRV